MRHAHEFLSIRMLAMLSVAAVLTACGGSEKPAPPAKAAPAGSGSDTSPEAAQPADAGDEATEPASSANPPEDKAESKTDSEPAPVAAPAGVEGRTLSGRVVFEGDAPKRRVIKMNADPACEKIHGDKKMGTEDVLVSKDGELANVLIHVTSGASGGAGVPDRAALIDQKGCIYEPHALALRVGQTLNIKNSDPTLHNIHCLAKENPEFNFGQPAPGVRDKVFRKPEIGIKFKCDVHPWMGAWVHVLDHPFFSISDRAGAFAVGGLPSGKITIEAWHEVLGTQTVEVDLSGGDKTDFVITFKGPEKL